MNSPALVAHTVLSMLDEKPHLRVAVISMTSNEVLAAALMEQVKSYPGLLLRNTATSKNHFLASKPSVSELMFRDPSITLTTFEAPLLGSRFSRIVFDLHPEMSEARWLPWMENALMCRLDPKGTVVIVGQQISPYQALVQTFGQEAVDHT